MKLGRLDAVIFVVSAIVLASLYGYGARVFSWFPDAYLDRALRQMAFHLGDPPFAAPRAYDRRGARILDAELVQPGYTFVATHDVDSGWRARLKLLDAHGVSRHEWSVDPTELFPNATVVRRRNENRRAAHGTYVLPDGDVILNIEYLGVARIDACSRVRWRLQNGAHHSIAVTDGGTFWLPVTSEATYPRSAAFPEGYPGWSRDINHDKLLHLDGAGVPLDSISVLDILFENGLEQYLIKARPALSTDLLHVNDVEPLRPDMAGEYPTLEAGDLLVSLRASDLVLIVDPDTKEVKWHSSEPFVQQHDPDFIGAGWIGVYDNRYDATERGTLLGGTRILAIQPHTGARETLFPTEVSETIYSPILGKWQMLANGNMLLTEGRAGRVLEVTPEGRTVWEWIHEPYDEEHTVEVTEGTRYDFSEEQISNWPCASAG